MTAAASTPRSDLCAPDHPALALLPQVPTRLDIERFGEFLLSLEPEHGIVDISTQHHYAESLYGRSVVVPAETFLVGLPHKQGCLVVCIGDITIWSEGKRTRFTGAHILNSSPGAPRVGFAHASTSWFTVHANLTGSGDVNTIEEALVEHAERLMTRRAVGTLAVEG